MADSVKEAAALLRGLKERVDRIESSVSEEGIPNPIRSVSDSIGIGDSVSVSTNTGGTFTADSSTADSADTAG